MAASQIPGYLPPRYRNALPPKSTHDRVRDYLARMTPGGILSSNFMASCEIASADGIRSVKCGRCKGLGFRDGDENKIAQWQRQLAKPNISPLRAEELREKLRNESICRRCEGTGFRERNAAREAADRCWNTVCCGKCRGTGEILNEDREDECPRCQGDGCVVPQTVRSTGSSKKGRLPPGATSFTDGAEAAWMPPEPEQEEQATEYTETALVLAVVADEAPDTVAAVREYHGGEGDKWAPHSWGRAFSLWPLTAGGRGLAELYLRRGQLERMPGATLMRPIDRIVAEREEESRTRTPDMLRRTLISKADQEARILEARMLAAINDAEARVG